MTVTTMPQKLDADVSGRGLQKAATGVPGLDQITGGGLPRGRPTLITGAAGCGKTLLGIEFLVRGALDYGEPGVMLAFEETADELAANVASLGYDLPAMVAAGQLAIDAFRLDPAEFVHSGAFDLDGLFVRLAYAVDQIGAKRVLLDTVEVLFGALHDTATVRSELGRLFRWLKQRGLTAVVTGEKGDGTVTRHGIEEYVSDCVITLDHRVDEQISTRRLRVVKYRGSLHGTNEYPFLITDRGVSVLPLSAMGLDHSASTERIGTGLGRLDHMLGGGIFRGASVLISGQAGTGKTTLAAQMVDAACARDERCLFLSFEESPAQLIRNMAAVGIDLARHRESGHLQMVSMRPTSFGLEMHLAELVRMLDDFSPDLVVVDAVTSLDRSGAMHDVTATITREMDVVKGRGATCVLTALTQEAVESSSADVSSLIDTWVLLRNIESNGERNRLLFVRKSRGSAHSNQVREFLISADGLDLLDVPIGADGAIVGSARLSYEAERAAQAASQAEKEQRRRRRLERHRRETEAQIATLRQQLADDLLELESVEAGDVAVTEATSRAASAMRNYRSADTTDVNGSSPRNRS